MTPRTVSALGTRQLLTFGVKHGLDPDALCRAAGITPDQLTQGPHVPHAWFAAILDALIARLPDVAVGFELGTFASLDQFSYLGQAMKHCGSGLECFRLLIQYAPLLDTQMRELPPALELDADRACLRVPSLRADRQVWAEATLVGFVACLRSLHGKRSTPLFVRFSGGDDRQRAVLERFFDAEVELACDCDELVFARSVLERPLVGADTTVRGRFVRAFLRRMADAEDPLTIVLRRVIDAELEHGAISQSRVARQLGMSARSLQRRLRERNLQYQALLEHARRRLATRWLADRSRSVEQIASALGYDARSFQRAFRRWTGMNPSAYRRAKAGAGGPHQPEDS